MAADDPSGDAAAPANGGGAGQVALLSDPVDVIIDKLLRCVFFGRVVRFLARCRVMTLVIPCGNQ